MLYGRSQEKGYYFLEDFEGEYIKTITREDVITDHKYTLACHGYSPEKARIMGLFLWQQVKVS